ncbi:MAG: hypothetical protein GXO32_03225, partial [Crenarchaeota archaeon]|nr:hypothetical protein [Thermoproteota archaeon]
VGLYTDPPTWQRIEQTYHILSTYLKSQGIEASLEKLSIEKGSLIPQARSIIETVLADHPRTPIELYLTGGPRILLASFYTATLTIPDENIERIRITVYGEGFPASITVEIGRLLILARLDEKSREILELIRDGYNRIESLLTRSNLPRSTLYKKLKDLENLGLIIKTGKGEYRIHPAIEQLI